MTDDQGGQPSASIPGWTETKTDLIYTNSMAITAGPFDVTLIFGQQDNASRDEVNSTPLSDEQVRVAMSWGHLKSMIPLMANVVAQYEQQFGEIPSPGFDQNWRA